jgi:UDP-N-acetylglucosamine 1-carboxyvinyltransferase
VTLRNVPRVRDLITMSKLLAFMDAKVSAASVPASEYVIEAPTLNHAEAPYELVKTMRASILTLGPLMARVGMARVSLPGGCAIGAAGGFAPEGAGADGRGDCDVARIH